MKYSEKNKPLVCMQTQNPCYKSGTKMTVKGILWHSTGANNPNLKRYVQPSDNASDKADWLKLLGTNSYKNDLNHTTTDIGLNAWIGKLADGTITSIQSMPWDYKPWGCASGSKGSCNNGWIQFEICEDGLKDKTYFEAVYKEACELTAYLCDMFNINPKGTVTVNGVKVPTILCHADASRLGFGSNHGDVLHWFPKFGKDMDDVREDVTKLIESKNPTSSITPTQPVEMYRIRKTWEDEKSQVGAYSDLNNAKKACDKAGNEYEVYNSKGVAIYPVAPAEAETSAFKVGDEVSLINGAVYSNKVKVPSWLYSYKMYVREVRKNGDLVISTKKTGAITGVVAATQVVPYVANATTPAKPTFVPYIVRIDTDVLNVRNGAGTNYKINTKVHKYELYTIVDEKNGWGKLKSGAGWISLQYTTKVK